MTWPGDVVLVAIIRDGHARPPDLDGSLEAGDELLFVTAQDYEKELAEMLSPREGSIAVSRPPPPASSDLSSRRAELSHDRPELALCHVSSACAGGLRTRTCETAERSAALEPGGSRERGG